jgi:metal-responsive CopG/Arc/MetJ family transcriptional regulator
MEQLMPRIRISVPEQLLNVATTRAEELGKSVDELYAEAIERYIDATKNSSAGSMRSRHMIPRSSPEVVVEIPEELFQRAQKVAKRLGKARHVMYAEALATHVGPGALAQADSALDRGHDLPSGAWRSTADSALDQGHDLPSGAWRPKKST